jgi:hypothetical protein
MAGRQHKQLQQLLLVLVEQLTPLQEPRQQQQQRGRLQTALVVVHTGATAGAAPRLRRQAPQQ